jgi:hypothetical protein
LTIVDDPCQPPVAGNIERVAELKFGNDARSEAQDEAYREIAGDSRNYQVFRTGGSAQGSDEHQCDCSEERRRQRQPVPVAVPVAVPQQEREREEEAARERLRQTAAGAAKAGALAATLMAIGAAAAEIAEVAWPVLLLL